MQSHHTSSQLKTRLGLSLPLSDMLTWLQDRV